MQRNVLVFALGIMLGGGTLAATSSVWQQRKPLRDYSPVGDTLPTVAVQRPDGKWVPLKDVVRGRPAVLYFYTVAECLSCSGLDIEFRVLRDEAPGATPLLVGIGAPPERFAEALKSAHLGDAVVVDEKNAVLQALGVKVEPLVVVVNAAGRIILADARPAPRSARFPMGDVLAELRKVYVGIPDSALSPVRRR